MDRKLSPLEQVLWLIDQGVPQNFIMVAHVSPPLTEPVLRKALDIVQHRHPPLKCKLKEAIIPEFVSSGVPEISLRTLDRQDDNHWIAEVEKEILEPVPWRTGPLFRVVLLHSPDKCDLLVSCCHIVSDALSGLKIVENLLRVADKLSRNEPVDEAVLPQRLSSIDLLRDDIKNKANSVDISQSENPDIPEPVELLGEREVFPEKRITRIIQRKLSAEETKMLIRRCRQEKTSVHGAICAAILQTIAVQIRNSQAQPENGPLMIGCCTPVNIRHLFTDPIGEDVGDFISDALHYQLIDDKASIWDAARNVKESLQKELELGKDIKAIIDVGDALKPDSTPVDMVRGLHELFPPVFVTNLGRLDIPQQFGGFSLENLHFSLSLNPAAKNGFALAVTSFRGPMTLNFLYAEPYFSKEKALEMVAQTMSRLKESIN